MLDYEDMLNGIGVENARDNFYIASHDLRGFVMEPQWVFDHLMKMSSEYETLKVEVESLSSFVVYIPMFVTCFSQVSKIDIDVITIGDDENKLNRILKLIDLGDNVHVNVITAPTDSRYDIHIRYDGCHELPKKMKRNLTKKSEDNQLQLTFF